MAYYVRVTTKKPNVNVEERFDLSLEDLNERFIQPYRDGRPIVVGGRTISMSELEKIEIGRSEKSSQELVAEVQAARSRSQIVHSSSPSSRVFERTEKVTDEFIIGPPGERSGTRIVSTGPESETSIPDPRSVFIVHGRNLQARDALFTFLRSLGLTPLEFVEAIRGTRRGSPYIGDILNYAFDTAQAVVVLLTPDDEARLRDEFHGSGEPGHETDLTGQARPNVLFEAGMALGRDEERTIMVQLGSVRPFSDISGRHVIHMDGRSEQRQDLAMRLQNAGCDVNMNGTDWHRAGDFASALGGDR